MFFQRSMLISQGQVEAEEEALMSQESQESRTSREREEIMISQVGIKEERSRVTLMRQTLETLRTQMIG